MPSSIRCASLAIGLLVGTPAFTTPVHAAPAAQITAQDARDIGVEAYTYLYPLVLMDVTRKVLTTSTPGRQTRSAPPNTFLHYRTYPTANDREVVRPNFDTLYSTAWLDLTRGPVVVSVPDTAGRYYLLPMIDMWTDVFAVPGKRTSGTEAARYAVVPPRWKGRLPEGVQRIDAPTPHVWIIGRTQTNGPADCVAVNALQDAFTITPFSHRGRGPAPVRPVVDPSVDTKTDPVAQVERMDAGAFFAHAAELMKIHPPHLTDWSMLARMKRVGLEPGRSFDLSKASPQVRTALADVPQEAMRLIRAKMPTLAPVTNGWQMNTDTMGVYGNHYLKRAAIALVGLGANQPEDAIYPLNVGDANGARMEGGRRYVLHFDKDQLPPVGAFWSVTMYDGDGFQVANRLDRFAIGDRDPLTYNADGSLDLYMQSESPGPQRESNWLPSPATGPLGVTMRLYAPKPSVLDGRWAPPAVKPVDGPK